MAASSSNPETMDTDPPGLSIAVERNPPESRLVQLGVRSWPKWGCPTGKFPVKFDARQTCYLLKGKVKAHIKGSSESVEFGAGDLVVFPKGLSCTWDVVAAVDKEMRNDIGGEKMMVIMAGTCYCSSYDVCPLKTLIYVALQDVFCYVWPCPPWAWWTMLSLSPFPTRNARCCHAAPMGCA